MLVYTRCGIERERERRGGWRGAWEDRGGYQEVLFFIFLIFLYTYTYHFFFPLFFLFLLHEDQSPGSIHSKDIQMLVARDDSVKIHRQLFVAGI